jgi:hypothetical protein
MATPLSYAEEKYHSAVLTLATTDEPLRTRVSKALVDFARHAGPPFADQIPSDVSDRIAELFRRAGAPPVLGVDDVQLRESLALLTDEEIATVAADVVDIFGRLRAALAKPE